MFTFLVLVTSRVGEKEEKRGRRGRRVCNYELIKGTYMGENRSLCHKLFSLLLQVTVPIKLWTLLKL